MARGIESQRRISKAFETRQVHKRYMAVVIDKPEPLEQDADGWALIEGSILLDWPNRPLHIIHPDGKPSQSRWRMLKSSDSASLIELEPVTGRTHQLRVHMQSIGHPMLGDSLYAPPEVRSLTSRLMLHAKSIQLAHPFTEEPLSFDSSLSWSAFPPFTSLDQ
jgi:tRNA pseudouridine32 synthase/23S rRNA pseudouridine746 synthase